MLDLEVWHSDRDAGAVIMVSRRQTREDHKTSHARISPALKAAISHERLDHLHTDEIAAT